MCAATPDMRHDHVLVLRQLTPGGHQGARRRHQGTRPESLRGEGVSHFTPMDLEYLESVCVVLRLSIEAVFFDSALPDRDE